MPKFQLQYHIAGTDFVAVEQVDADTVEAAGALAGERITASETLQLPHDQEMVVVPRSHILYVTVRPTVDRRRASPLSSRYDLDDGPVVEPWAAGGEAEATGQ